jgi:hypothetical protein
MSKRQVDRIPEILRYEPKKHGKTTDSVKGFYLVMYVRNLSLPDTGNCDVCKQGVLLRGNIRGLSVK